MIQADIYRLRSRSSDRGICSPRDLPRERRPEGRSRRRCRRSSVTVRTLRDPRRGFLNAFFAADGRTGRGARRNPAFWGYLWWSDPVSHTPGGDTDTTWTPFRLTMPCSTFPTGKIGATIEVDLGLPRLPRVQLRLEWSQSEPRRHHRHWTSRPRAGASTVRQKPPWREIRMM